MRSFTTAVAALAACTSYASARSLDTRQVPDRFYLQTQVVPGVNDCGSNKQGLYLFSYHTGAGEGMATGEATAPSGDSDSWFYLNGTQLAWTYPDNDIGPWPVNINYGAYQAFNAIEISIATDVPPTEGYFVNGTGLQNAAAEGGWLACDWWYDAPQIFAVADYEGRTLPSSCSKVNLIPVPAA